jgi:hypothetical protein
MPDAAKQKEAMSRLSFLVGRWEGDGWFQMGPGERQEFRQTEEIGWKLDSLVIQVQGHGVGKNPAEDAGGAVHEALGLISYDDQSSRYRFMAYTAEGRVADAVATVGERSLVWSFPVSSGIQIRYTMMVDEEGRWHETGELSRDRENWTPFLDMTLQKAP